MGNPKSDAFHNDFAGLRKVVDSNDKFMQGCSVMQGRGSGYQRRVAETPEWLNNNDEVQKLLEVAFPYWRTNPHHRKWAARWSAVIYYYHRMGRTAHQVAIDLHVLNSKGRWSAEYVQNMASRIRRVRAGLRSDGKPRKPTPSARGIENIVSVDKSTG
jgi:hypothetical protein